MAEIKINRFQLGVLLSGEGKKFYDLIISNNIYCSRCHGYSKEGIIVDIAYLTVENDIKVYGRCKVCNGDVSRLFTFGGVEEFNQKANKLRRSIKGIAV